MISTLSYCIIEGNVRYLRTFVAKVIKNILRTKQSQNLYRSNYYKYYVLNVNEPKNFRSRILIKKSTTQSTVGRKR